MIAYESEQVKKQTAPLMTHTSATQEKSYTRYSDREQRKGNEVAGKQKKERSREVAGARDTEE